MIKKIYCFLSQYKYFLSKFLQPYIFVSFVKLYSSKVKSSLLIKSLVKFLKIDSLHNIDKYVLLEAFLDKKYDKLINIVTRKTPVQKKNPCTNDRIYKKFGLY